MYLVAPIPDTQVWVFHEVDVLRPAAPPTIHRLLTLDPIELVLRHVVGLGVMGGMTPRIRSTDEERDDGEPEYDVPVHGLSFR